MKDLISTIRVEKSKKNKNELPAWLHLQAAGLRPLPLSQASVPHHTGRTGRMRMDFAESKNRCCFWLLEPLLTRWMEGACDKIPASRRWHPVKMNWLLTKMNGRIRIAAGARARIRSASEVANRNGRSRHAPNSADLLPHAWTGPGGPALCWTDCFGALEIRGPCTVAQAARPWGPPWLGALLSPLS